MIKVNKAFHCLHMPESFPWLSRTMVRDHQVRFLISEEQRKETLKLST